jgi:nucleoid-associated protein YgaU
MPGASVRLNRRSLHVGLCAIWTAFTLSAAACGGGGAATNVTPVAPAPSGSVPVPSPSRPPLASPGASPSAIVGSATPGPASSEVAGGQSYEVQAGDTLATIAQQFYGDPSQWRRIYDANKDAIGPDPDKLKLGTRLTIPPKAS